MNTDYTMWSTPTKDVNQPKASAFGVDYRYDQRAWDDPAKIVDEISKKNIDLLKKVSNDSIIDGVQVWLGAVSGGWFAGDADAAKKAGVKDQPDWDYIFQPWKWGITKEQAEIVGNMNYGATGYALFMNILTGIGISETASDQIVRPLLRAGGGFYQAFSDYRRNRFSKVDHTWYGEEVSDVASVEAGMDLAAFRRISRTAEQLGVKLEAKDFGLQTRSDWGTTLIDDDLVKKLDIENLNQEIEKLRDQIRKEEQRKREEQKNNSIQLPLG